MLGKDVKTGEQVDLGDTERRSGLYVLGKSGMGKSNLLLYLTYKDVLCNYGLFFLDPHGDAINAKCKDISPGK